MSKANFNNNSRCYKRLIYLLNNDYVNNSVLSLYLESSLNYSIESYDIISPKFKLNIKNNINSSNFNIELNILSINRIFKFIEYINNQSNNSYSSIKCKEIKIVENTFNKSKSLILKYLENKTFLFNVDINNSSINCILNNNDEIYLLISYLQQNYYNIFSSCINLNKFKNNVVQNQVNEFDSKVIKSESPHTSEVKALAFTSSDLDTPDPINGEGSNNKNATSLFLNELSNLDLNKIELEESDKLNTFLEKVDIKELINNDVEEPIQINKPIKNINNERRPILFNKSFTQLNSYIDSIALLDNKSSNLDLFNPIRSNIILSMFYASDDINLLNTNFNKELNVIETYFINALKNKYKIYFDSDVKPIKTLGVVNSDIYLKYFSFFVDCYYIDILFRLMDSKINALTSVIPSQLDSNIYTVKTYFNILASMFNNSIKNNQEIIDKVNKEISLLHKTDNKLHIIHDIKKYFKSISADCNLEISLDNVLKFSNSYFKALNKLNLEELNIDNLIKYNIIDKDTDVNLFNDNLKIKNILYKNMIVENNNDSDNDVDHENISFEELEKFMLNET